MELWHSSIYIRWRCMRKMECSTCSEKSGGQHNEKHMLYIHFFLRNWHDQLTSWYWYHDREYKLLQATFNHQSSRTHWYIIENLRIADFLTNIHKFEITNENSPKDGFSQYLKKDQHKKASIEVHMERVVNRLPLMTSGLKLSLEF